MPTLTTVDMKLVDSLFGMYSGYVLDFSNSTFDTFFARDIGVNINDEVYATYGTSKGKKLRRFLEVGQPRAIAKTLAALWEYRESSLMDKGESDKVPNGRARLSIVIERLGGAALRSQASTFDTTPRSELASEVIAAIAVDFRKLVPMDDAAQARGYAFEGFLKNWFDAWGLDARGAFRLKGEQIDGSFQHEASTYLVEAKWRNALTDASGLRSFQEKVGDRLEGTRGLFVSYSGFTQDGLAAFTARRVILMDGLDIHDALERRLPLGKVIAAKVRRASEERRPFISVRQLFP